MAPKREQQQEQPAELQGSVPSVMVQQAEAAVHGNTSNETDNERQHAGRDVPTIQHPDSFETTASELDVPPPAYGETYGAIHNQEEGMGTKASMGDDGRVNIRIDQHSKKLSSLLVPALRHQQELATQEQEPPPPYIPPFLGGDESTPPPPPMNVVIHVVGSRGDVQPFVALGKVLKDTYGHRVRLATHPVFKDFVSENGLEFFSIGGDPAELMAFMVKNPGLMPGFDTLRNGDVGKRRKEIGTMVKGCWRSCFEAGDGLGPEVTEQTVEDWNTESSTDSPFANKPFVADAIIANPPSFAHIHCAEKLGIPLHVMFTMPYSPTQAFPHPLANIQSSNADPHLSNYMSYAMVDMMTWQGLGDIINRFRQKSLGLEPISLMWAPGMLQRLKVPHTYCWSPALIPKPKDWGQHISISGFFFLNLASNYTPAPDLQAFLDAGPPPVYIGFGSIVLDDPTAMTKLIFDAVRQCGQRVLFSKGWGGLGADELGKPDEVFMLGNVPHDWLFKHVSAVVHHGGAGTTAAGITAGKPTLVVPFFGDQPFWGAMVAKAGAGPEPIPHKQLTAENLAQAIEKCLEPQSQERAHELAARIAEETGTQVGAQKFHQQLDVDKLRCSLAPSRAAVWRLKRTEVRFSALAACTLSNEGLLDFNDLKLFRPREYETDTGPMDPITGGASALVGTMGTMMMGVADFPVEALKLLKIHPDATKKQPGEGSGSNDSSKGSDHDKSTDESKLSRQSTEASELSAEPTPTTSRSGSTFNLEESLAKIRTPTSPGSDGSLSPHRNSRASVSQSMADALNGKLGKERTRSRSHSRSRSRGGEGQPDLRQHVDTGMATGKGVGRIIGAGFKSPMEFSMGVADGFRNAPKLYGDDTVRKREKVTDFRSGLRAATKEFGLGMYDGISGLVTQPMKGAQKEGAAGFFKGVGKGIGGVMLKPGAAVFSIPGYTMKGVYKELQKQMGSSVNNYIIAARTAQGFDDWQHASDEERQDIIQRWKHLQKDLKKKRNPDELVREILQEQMAKKKEWSEARQKAKDSGDRRMWGRSRTSSSSNIHRGSDTPHYEDPESKMLAIEANAGTRGGASLDLPRGGSDLQHANPGPSTYDAETSELEETIRLSVQETSRGNAEEDATIERAIRASMAEIARSKGQAQQGDDDEEALRRAMAASVQEAKKAGYGEGVPDADLERALAQSLKEQRRQHGSDSEWDSDAGTDEDEDYQRALRESKHPATRQDDPPPYDPGHLGGTTQEEFEEQQKHNPGEKTQQEKTEEQIVLEYAKKQSLLEEQHRKQTAKKGESSSSAANHDEDDEELKRAMELSMQEHK